MGGTFTTKNRISEGGLGALGFLSIPGLGASGLGGLRACSLELSAHSVPSAKPAECQRACFSPHLAGFGASGSGLRAWRTGLRFTVDPVLLHDA